MIVCPALDGDALRPGGQSCQIDSHAREMRNQFWPIAQRCFDIVQTYDDRAKSGSSLALLPA